MSMHEQYHALLVFIRRPGKTRGRNSVPGERTSGGETFTGTNARSCRTLHRFEGVSPINRQSRGLISALERELAAHDIPLPVYWGNRNWHPLLPDTVRRMRDEGVKHALAFVTSAFGSYSGCRQYRENLEAATAAVPDAPRIDKLPPFWDHPGFIETVVDRVRETQARLPGAEVVYTAHSIPLSMACTSPYEQQLRDACRKVNDALGLGDPVLVFQSRSGPPAQPWLEPDIGDYMRSATARRLIVVPIGFLSDHMEVVYDLDTEVAQIAKDRGIELVRAGTAGTHPRFIQAVREMVAEAIKSGISRDCAPDCCRLTASRGGSQSAGKVDESGAHRNPVAVRAN